VYQNFGLTCLTAAKERGFGLAQSHKVVNFAPHYRPPPKPQGAFEAGHSKFGLAQWIGSAKKHRRDDAVGGDEGVHRENLRAA